MTRMGMLYHNSLGVDRDPVEAVRWWRRGAEAGDADGQAMLAAALHLGLGVERNPIEAFVWLTRAANAGSQLAAPFFDTVRASLSAEDFAEAQRRAGLPVKTGGS
jgi:TPR repeat protein